MKLRRVGFYRELYHGEPTDPTMLSLLSDDENPHERQIVDYLRHGVIFIASPGAVTDVISRAPSIIATPSVLTDGVWAWPDDLAYYVGRYHLSLPSNFVSHLQAHGFQVPHESDIPLTELEL